MRTRLQLAVLFVVSAIAAASIWFYFDRILIAHQIVDAAVHARPRGNLSDLYPRWLGARELLLHSRNPYSNQVTLQIQEGYYGRLLDASRPNDPKDQQGFAYPVYVVFLLAPLLRLPFHQVQIFFHWLLIGLIVASIPLWLRALRWPIAGMAMASAALLAIGSVPAVQGIKLQQLSLLVAALLSGSAACMASGFLFCGGVLLALATIKPQLAFFVGVWAVLWAVSDWRERRRFVFGLSVAMALLLAGSEIVLPGWMGMFFRAVQQYHRYTQNQSVLDQLLPGMFVGKIAALLAVAVAVVFLWKLRHAPAESPLFGSALALVMATTVLVVPMYAPYNQVLLLPAILLLVRDRRRLVLSGSRGLRFVYAAGAFALLWQWIASFALWTTYLISPEQAMNGWKWPFFATFALPVLIFALTVIDVQGDLRGPAIPQGEADGGK
ncbi:MAG: glycosyltransferase family 87 protein [Candidatus Sulfotelmatobacter sp.]